MAKTVDADAAKLRETLRAYEGPSEGTVVKFEYTFTRDGDRDENGKKVKRQYYTYIALWVADKWFLSGRHEGSLSRVMTNHDFMTLLAGEQVRSADVAVEFDSFKS